MCTIAADGILRGDSHLVRLSGWHPGRIHRRVPADCRKFGHVGGTHTCVVAYFVFVQSKEIAPP